MSEFKREERYIVVKLKHLAGLQVAPLRNFLRENRVPTLNCVVVESDWPEYEPVWQMIERRMTGQPAVSASEELNAVLHWRGKHAQIIRERDALQHRLNAADERVDLLEGLLRQFSEVAHGGFIDDDHVRRVRRDVDAALKPAQRHPCTHCGGRGILGSGPTFRECYYCGGQGSKPAQLI